MPYRSTPLVTGQIYHIYNRGSEKRRITESNRDNKRLIRVLNYYQFQGPKPRFSQFSDRFILDESKKIVGILIYCIMPNHLHLLIKQLVDNGITEFMSKISNSYTKYFNTRQNRVGPLFQGEFKSVLIENDEQLLHVSRYIHLNPVSSYLVENPEDYKWSSYHEYISGSLFIKGMCERSIIIGYFKSPKEYQKFVMDQKDYGRTLELVKHQIIEHDEYF